MLLQIAVCFDCLAGLGVRGESRLVSAREVVYLTCGPMFGGWLVSIIRSIGYGMEQTLL